MSKKRIILINVIIISFIISMTMLMCFNYLNKVKTTGNVLTKSDEVNVELNIIPIDLDMAKENIVLSNITQALYENTKVMRDNKYRAEDAELILIGTIKSIDGMINYNPTTEDYVMTRTIGTIEIDKVIKGNYTKPEIEFMKLGGMIPLSEYEKGIAKSKIEKLGLNKMTKEEKENKYILEQLDGDIEAEKGKTYLFYLKYYSDYDKYALSYLQYGMKEVKLNENISRKTIKTLKSDGMKEIMVKNNENGNYEALDSILPSTIKGMK